MSYYEKNRKEIDELIDKILDERADNNFTNVSDDFINHFFNREEAERIILERDGKDLQKEFKEAIKKNPMVIENINQSLDGKTKEEIEKEEREYEIDKKTEELVKDENLTHEEQEKIKEEAEDEKEVTTEALKALVVKAVYEHTLDEYHKLREDLYTGYNGQVKTGELTNGDKMDTKLVMYQKYIRNLDMQYRGYTGYFINEDDEALKAKENKYFRREQQNEKSVYSHTEENLDRVQQLNEELNAIAEEISWRSANSSIMASEDFNREMEKLQEMYLEKTIELRALDPNLRDLMEEVHEKQKTDALRDRVVGQRYEDLKYKKGIIDPNNASLDNYTDGQEDRIEEKINVETEKVNENVISSIEEQIAMAESAFTRFESTENIEDYNDAISHLKMAEQMSGITPTGIEYEDISTQESPDELKENQMDEENAKEDDLRDDMGLNRTPDEKITNLKASYHERMGSLNEKLNSMRSKEEQINESVMVRKMN